MSVQLVPSLSGDVKPLVLLSPMILLIHQFEVDVKEPILLSELRVRNVNSSPEGEEERGKG